MKAVDPTHQGRSGADHAGQLAGRDHRRQRRRARGTRRCSPSRARRSTSWTCTGTRAAAAAESLARINHLPDATYLLRQQLARYAGPNADRIGISFTELNVDAGRNTQPAALFLADVYSGLLDNGVFTVQWWNMHNGMGTVSQVAGQTDYGDFGMLSSGACTEDGSVCEPPLNTPFAPYHGLSMMKLFAKTGDQFVRAGTDEPWSAPTPSAGPTASSPCC